MENARARLMPKCRICKQTRDKDQITYKQLKPVCRFEVNSDCIPKLGLWLADRDRKKREKADKAVFGARKEKLDDTVPNWTKKAQKAFNSYIRERDYDQPCISCQKHPKPVSGIGGSNIDCGHYRSTGANPELRFDEDNAHKQCSRPCNKDLSGNTVNYRIHLRKKIGDRRLEILEGPHEPKRYRVEDLKEIAKHYNAKARELKRSREARQ
jgi:hypothetical protein